MSGHRAPRKTNPIAASQRAVGAVGNGELLIELAEALERFAAEGGCESESSWVGRSLADPSDELAETLVEWALGHPVELADARVVGQDHVERAAACLAARWR